MPLSLRSLLLLLGLGILLANCAKWKVEPYDLVPQVKTGSATTPATTSVQVDCIVNELGPNTLQEFGIVYSSANQQPTVNDTKAKATGTSGTAQVMLNGLQPNTTYYYRTYAINNKNLIGYGDVQSFKTAAAIADVRTLNPVGTAGTNSFQVQVQVANAGAITIREYGIVYSTSVQMPTTGDTKIPATGTTGATATVSINNLQPNTLYYYRAYAITDAGVISYGEAKQIKTGEPAPIVETLDPVGTASTTAVQVQCQVTNAGAITLKEYGICYSSTNQTPTTADSKATAVGSGTATTVTISPLQPGTTYYYRAYAISEAGVTTYGVVKQIKTGDVGLTIETLDAVANSAGMNAIQIQFQLANPGNVSLKEFGIYYSASNALPTAADSKAGATAVGASTLTISNLQPGTTYNYRAYVTTNAGVTSYGAAKKFTTLINSLVIFGNKDKKIYAVHAITGAKQWEYITNGATINTSTAFANGNIYVGGFDGYLYAIEAQTGIRKWARLSSGLRFESSPVIANGLLYIGSNEKWVSAFDINTGDAKWRYVTTDKIISSPALSNNVLYFGGSGDNDTKVYAVRTDGTLLWTFATGGYILSSPTVAGGVVYIGSSDKKLYALDAVTKAQKWATPLPDKVNSCPLVVGNLVYVGSDDFKLYALNTATGAVVWSSIKTGSYVGSSPTHSNGIVYVGSGDNKVYAFDAATGAKKWDFTTSSEIYASPVVAGGLVYIGSNDGKMYCLDAVTGVKKWEFASGDQVYATPIVLLNGTVIGDYPSISGITN